MGRRAKADPVRTKHPMSKANTKQLAKREEGHLVTGTLSPGKHLPPAVQEFVATALNHTLMIRSVVEQVMVENVHYGVIPGTDKPTLYQPGAQALAVAFGFRACFHITRESLENGHREYFVDTSINAADGVHGVGSCSTMESKYRYRNAEEFTDTGNPVPSTYWNLKTPRDKKRALGTIMDDMSSAYGVKKVEGQWHIVKYPEERTLVENPNIADCYNTVLKIAKKRSYVDAILNITGASDTFGQDLEDLYDNLAALQAVTGIDMDGSTTKTFAPKAAAAPPSAPSVPSDWRLVQIHVGKQAALRKKLGDVGIAYIRALKEGWLDKINWQESPDTTREDRRLRKAIIEAITEHEALGKKETHKAASPPAPANEPPLAAKGQGEAVAAQETAATPGSREALIAQIEHALLSEEVEEADFFGELRKAGMLGDKEAEITGLKDFPEDWLPDLLAQVPGLLKQWGYVK